MRKIWFDEPVEELRGEVRVNQGTAADCWFLVPNSVTGGSGRFRNRRIREAA